MKLRPVVVLGFCASFYLSSMAIAATPRPQPTATPVANALEVDTVAASKADAEALKKKKKLAAEAKAKEKAKLAAKAKAEKDKKLAAKAKAEEKKKLEAKAKAKAAEKEKLAAKAKAEKDKQLAAKAKADEQKKLARAKAAEEKKLASAKAAEERKLKRAKETEERKLAKARAAEEKKFARAKAAEERKQVLEAKAKAKEEQRLAKIQAEEARRQQALAAAEAARQAEISRLASMEVVQTGNNGELRSESALEAPKDTGLFSSLFGGSKPVQKQSMLPETRALDAALEIKEAKKKFKVKPDFEPQTVQFSGYSRGTIVIDTSARYLYLVEGSNRARRYAIAVGRDGLQYKGAVKVGDKQEWPRWIPTKEMQAREPAKYGKFADGMPGGGQNPLGARAIYLYENGRDTHLRIHGTTAPETIGTDSSNGCFRMINEHVMDLYRRVPMGTQVVVL